ncbi:hypothetical protein EBU99_11185 [bacterium]|nr:hypothetical protein [bacterium]
MKKQVTQVGHPPGTGHGPSKSGAVFAVLGLVTMVVLFLSYRRRGSIFKNAKTAKSIPGMPKHAQMNRAIPMPIKKEGGQRSLDALNLSPEAAEKRVKAFKLVKENRFADAARLLEEINMQREAIDILESNGLLDDAAGILMRMNRPNRAAVIFERNKIYEKAALYYLRAKLVDDAKRCCRQIKEFSIALSTEMAVLFAEAGDKHSALRLLAGINDRNRIIKITRETFAYTELAVFLDSVEARTLLLEALSVADLEHVLQNMPSDDVQPLTRVIVWVNESSHPDWLIPVFKYIGDKRDVGAEFAQKITANIIEAFVASSERWTDETLSKQGQALEWTARAMHDAGHMRAAACAYQKLKFMTLAGKCWALAGEPEKAFNQLMSPQGDAILAEAYRQELSRLGWDPSKAKPIQTFEKEIFARIFFNIDPDTEKNRTESPFSIAS